MRKQLLIGGLSAGAVVGSLLVDTGDMSAPTRRKDIDHVGMYNLIVEIDGVSVGRFESVSGLSMEIKPAEEISASTSGEPMVTKRPGATTAGNVTLAGGWLATKELWDWWEKARASTKDPASPDLDPKRNFAVVVYDYQGNELRRWDLMGCWPTKWKFPQLDGKGGDIAVEEVEFVVEELITK